MTYQKSNDKRIILYISAHYNSCHGAKRMRKLNIALKQSEKLHSDIPKIIRNMRRSLHEEESLKYLPSDFTNKYLQLLRIISIAGISFSKC